MIPHQYLVIMLSMIRILDDITRYRLYFANTVGWDEEEEDE